MYFSLLFSVFFFLLALGLSFDCVIFAGHWCLPFCLFFLFLICLSQETGFSGWAYNGGSMSCSSYCLLNTIITLISSNSAE